MGSNTMGVPLKITGVYLLLAAAWIAFSDQLLLRITTDPTLLARLSMIKGWGFVLATSLLLYILLRREFAIRSLSEQARLESENLYRQLADSITDVFFALDPELRYIFWNQASERFTGIPAADALGKPLDKLFPGMGESNVAGMYRRVLATRQAESMVMAYPGSSQPLYFEISAYPSALGVFVHARDITRRRKREREMETIASVSLGLRTATSRAQILPLILTQILELLQAEGASIAVPHAEAGGLVIEAGAGKSAPMVGYVFPRGQGIVGQVYQTAETYQTDNVYADARLFRPDIVFAPAVICMPLITTGQLTNGVLWVNRSQPFEAEDVRLIKIIAEMGANAIHRAAIFENLQQVHLELSHSYDDTLQGWSRALDLRDHDTEGHSGRVTELTLKLAEAFGIPEAEQAHIRRGALLHDIGKIGVPDAILHKPGPLDAHEWQIMRRHPEFAFRLLSPIAYLRPALDIPYCHHERWDGSGYPRGLKGEQIPLPARIFALADVWDAICSHRPYRCAYSRESAIEYIRAQAGKHFDPQAARLFLEFIQNGAGGAHASK